MSEIGNNAEVLDPESGTPESIDDGIPSVSFSVSVSEVVQAPIDTTLSISGMSADAKATGDAIRQAQTELQGEIDGLSEDLSGFFDALFPVGSIYVSTSDSAPSFGGEDWNWIEVLIPVKQGDLIDGTRSFVEVQEGDETGTLHFWKRIENTGATE